MGEIRFEDGAAYERYMGVWSQEAGARFLDWLALPPRLRWLDVGCGNGAFTELIVDRCMPAAVSGVDPSDAQLAFARSRFTARAVHLKPGNAMALPFEDDTFDVAVMPLVIFFVPDPALGVAEMARVVTAGGTVAAYAWDLAGGGFPYALVQAELRAMGYDVSMPPSADASNLDRLQASWSGAGLGAIETRTITVQRTYTSFDDFWTIAMGGPSLRGQLGALERDDASRLRGRLREQLSADATGRIRVSARANAVRGRVPQRSRSTS
jgi:SAM-dependent methyltransferase